MQQPAIHTVVFDLGNVLIDWNPRYLYREFFPSDAAGMEHFLSTVCTRDWHERHDAGASFADNARPLLEKYAGDARMQELITAWGARFSEMLRPMPESIEILNELKRSGVALLSLFKDITVSGDEGVKKPDPRLYEILVKRNGIDPHSAIYIDDRAENLEPAKAMGFTTILFTGAAQLRADLAKHHLLRPLSSLSPNFLNPKSVPDDNINPCRT